MATGIICIVIGFLGLFIYGGAEGTPNDYGLALGYGSLTSLVAGIGLVNQARRVNRLVKKERERE